MHSPVNGDERVKRDEANARKEFDLLRDRLQQLPPDLRARLQGDFVKTLVSDTVAIDTPRGSLSFVLLGRSTGGRAVQILTKQPATIEWIDAFRPDSVFWDVGANIGTYALYAALRDDMRVVAFEPAAVNYFLLSANCEANRLDARVDCLQIGVGRERAIARLEVSQFAPAQSFSFRGKPDKPYAGRQAALVLSIDQLVEDYGLPCPNYIKIDVPGLTASVLEGGTRVLRRREVREVHIECREHSKNGQRMIQTLEGYGLVRSGGHGHGGSADVTFTRRA